MNIKHHFQNNFESFQVENIHHAVNENRLLSPEKEPTSAEGRSIPQDSILLQKTGLTEDDWISHQDLIEYEKSTEFSFGDRFDLIIASWGNTEIGLARFKVLEDLIAESRDYIIHPCIIDACLQTKVCIDLKKTALNHPIAPHLPIGMLAKKLIVILCFLHSLISYFS